MNNGAELLISNQDGIYSIKVEGRATFECAPPLRNLAKTLEQVSFKKICVDLGECVWMDSTFMGILAMLGLHARRVSADMIIYNADEQNQNLLCGLGLKKLFTFATGTVAGIDGTELTESSSSDAAAKSASAQTVLDAHKTLMNVDEQNVKKFERVVDMVQKDLNKMNDTEN